MKLCTIIQLAVCVALWRSVSASEIDLTWGTFLGGSSGDYASSIAIDVLNNVYVLGWTESADFPIASGAFDTTISGAFDVFVARLNWAGNALDYATFIGGSGCEWAYGIAVDHGGNVYLGGTTTSSDFPVTHEAFDTTYNSGCDDAFMVRINPSGDTLDYATYLGGGYGDYGRNVAVDQSGNAYLAGWTMSVDFPVTAGALDTTYNGGDYDVFVTKFNSSGSALVFSSFIGGSDRDCGYAIALDDSSNAYLTGSTRSADFPTTAGALDSSFNGGIEDVFVVKLKPNGDNMAWATFLGGGGADAIRTIATDSACNVYLAGRTSSQDFPTTATAFDTSYNAGDSDAFAVKLNMTGSQLVFATLLGGDDQEEASSVAVNKSGNMFVIGHTESADFPTTAGAFDTSFNGNSDIYVVELDASGSVLNYATFFGGNAYEEGGSIAVDKTNGVFVSGSTTSSDLPVSAGAFDTTFNGGNSDVFVAKFGFAGEEMAPPGMVADLQVGLCGDALLLFWSPVTIDTSGNPLAIHLYRVYRDTITCISYGYDPFDSTASSSYLDTSGGVGKTGRNYFYAVTAISGNRESEFSAVVGEVDRQLITLPKSH